MTKFFTTATMALALVATANVTANAPDEQEWSLFTNEGKEIGMTDMHNGTLQVYVSKLYGGFYIATPDGRTDYGYTDPVDLNTPYTLELHGNNIALAGGVTYISDAVVSFTPATASMTISGNPVTESSTILSVHIAGTFNDWSVDSDNELSNERGTQVYTGRIDMSDDTEMVEWMIYIVMSDGSIRKLGVDPSVAISNPLEVVVSDEYQGVVSDKAAEYDVFFNMAIGLVRLTPVRNTDEKTTIIEPSPEGYYNLLNEFKLTFEGYNSAMPDASMYDVYNAPGTFTELSTGIVRSRVGAQALPQETNYVMLQLSQSIFNKKYLSTAGVEAGEYNWYVTNDLIRENGKFVLSLPANVIYLNDGVNLIQGNEPMEFFFNLGEDTLSGVENVAADYQNMDIYTLDGTLVVRNASASDYNALPKGVYVMKGKKVLVK